MSFHPQTPQSPSQLSPISTDPSLSMASSISTTATTLPTPAHSINGSSMPSDMAHEMNLSMDSPPHKRKRAIDDSGDEREQKKVHIEDRRLGIDELHLDVGEKYLLCRTQHQPSRPRLTEDLFEKYGLTGIAADVARVLPNGEKNSIRKTYKGHIKKLGVNGRWDSHEADPMAPDGFVAMLNCPEDIWQMQFVHNKEIDKGYAPEVRARMMDAVSLSKGIVPKSIWDSSVLGDMAPGAAGKMKSTAPNTPLPSSVTPSTGFGLPQARPKPLQQLGAQGVARPQRNMKKRSYGDDSFEGYGDGYDDDGGYSTADGDSAAKRRKKNTASPFPQMRQPSAYGPGMVGI